MASYDRKFEIVQPSLDVLTRRVLTVSDVRLLDPTNTAVVPLIPGELVQLTSEYKYARASDAAVPSYFTIEDRGDMGVQASRKLSALMGPTFEADTIVFDTALLTLGAKVMYGAVNNALSGSLARAGLIAHTGSNFVIGYITRLAAANGGRLRIIQTGL